MLQYRAFLKINSSSLHVGYTLITKMRCHNTPIGVVKGTLGSKSLSILLAREGRRTSYFGYCEYAIGKGYWKRIACMQATILSKENEMVVDQHISSPWPFQSKGKIVDLD